MNDLEHAFPDIDNYIESYEMFFAWYHEALKGMVYEP